jgi:CLIP-associating protein 1/2
MAYLTTSQAKPAVTMKRSTQTPITKDMSKSQSEPPTFAMLKDAGDGFAGNPPTTDTKLKDDENATKPWSISSARDFEDMSQDIHGLFDGKETEQNWDKRRKAIIKMSRITHGNAPIEYRAQYTFFIKSQLDGILKVVDSLRTNVSTAGLNLLQHIADTLGHGVDFMVDFVAETLITRCCNTSKVKRDPAIATFETIISNATCNRNLLHHIISASEHKDPNARTAVSGWLTALLTKYGRHCDQAGVLDFIEKCIKNGLNDAKPQVRTPMRSTYGMYAKLWPDRAERLRSNLDPKTQKLLESNNTVEPAKSSFKRPSIRDIKAAKKKEMDSQEGARPESAQSKRPTLKDIKAAKTRETESKDARPASAQSNRSSGRDAKVSKKRDMERENGGRPPSAQSNRRPGRDIKTIKKRDVELEDARRPPSSQSNDVTKKRDAEAADTARPMSAHMHSSISERRFHILSSAPMRPQRGFVDLKRVVPRPARSLQQQPDLEVPPLSQSDEYGAPKQMERKVHAPRNAALPADEFDLSRLELTAAKIMQIKMGDTEIQTGIQSMAALPAVEIESATFGLSDGTRDLSIPGSLVDEAKASEQYVDVHRNGSSSLKHDRTQNERPIKIHEDKASAHQDDQAELLSIAKRRSAERTAVVQDLTNVPSKTKSVTPPSSPTVLREIDQLNETVEPVKRQEITRQKYLHGEAAERNRSVSPHNRHPDKARKQLSRAIEKIRARTMDDYGYRRLQGLVKIHDALFQDEQRYDDLLLALLDTLETRNNESRVAVGRQSDHKFQILVTIRLMLVYNAKYCAAYYTRALAALITARRNFESRCHIVGGLEETAEEIVTACSPSDVIDHILNVLEVQEYDDAGYRAISMGLHILSGLVARIKGNDFGDHTQEKRLTRFALKCLRNENSETRRATIAFCVELRRLIHPEERYFQLVAGGDESLKSLLTYFIATTRRR